MKDQMEEMLKRYIFKELESSQPILRARALHFYGAYGHLKFKDSDHLKQVVTLIANNMTNSSPLPVKYYAAWALDKMLANKEVQELVRPDLPKLLKCYLSLMNDIDNEELVQAFENVMSIFYADMKPFAIDICTHLRELYIRCFSGVDRDAFNIDGMGNCTATALFTSMRRILDVAEEDIDMILKIEKIMMPCLQHCLT